MLYDDQATQFDDRAGIPADAAEAVARELAALVGLSDGQTVLDVGCGTGSLSLPLLRLPIRYVGFDQSAAMLEVFRQRAAEAGLAAELHAADGNGRWPAEDARVDVVFSARALHHLDPAHVVAEVRRVTRGAGGWLVTGRVRRPPDSPKSVLRRQMRRMLEAEGFAGRSHDAGAQAVFAALEAEGGRRADPRVVARWTVPHRPADSIASWEGKSGLAGLEVPPEVKSRVLNGLRGWASSSFGDLQREMEQPEQFELAAICLRAY
ncbi:MAG TPA: class I SAM-dependent methyltransferase [Longimicrobium sp.]|nr:class I SAM-dependent methyltransferase [Longimicrobium sp.]